MNNPGESKKDRYPTPPRASIGRRFMRVGSFVVQLLVALLCAERGWAYTADAKININEFERSTKPRPSFWEVQLMYTSVCQRKVSAEVWYIERNAKEVNIRAIAEKLIGKSIAKLKQQCPAAEEVYVSLTEKGDFFGRSRVYGVLKKSLGWKFEERGIGALKAQQNVAAFSLLMGKGVAKHDVVFVLHDGGQLDGFFGSELGGTISEVSVVRDDIENSNNYRYRVRGYMAGIDKTRVCENPRDGVYSWGAFELTLLEPEVGRRVEGVYVPCGALGQARRTETVMGVPAAGPGGMPMPIFEPTFYKKLFGMIEVAASGQNETQKTQLAFEPLVTGPGFSVVPQEAGWCGTSMKLSVYYEVEHSDRNKVLGDSYQEFALNKIVRRIPGACPTADFVELKNYRVGETEPYDTYLYQINDRKNRGREAYGGGNYYAHEERHTLSEPMVRGLYEQSCMACHELGVGGAPLIGDARMKRIGIAQPKVEAALNGAKRDPGIHFADFHCRNCSWSDLIALTRYMVNGKRNPTVRQIADLPKALQPLAHYAAAPSVKSLLDSAALDSVSPYVSALYRGRYGDVDALQRAAIATHFTDFVELYSYYCGDSYQGRLKSIQLTYVERKDEWDAIYLTEKRTNLVKVPAQYHGTYARYAGNFAVTGWFDPDESDGGLQKLRDKGLLIRNVPGTSMVAQKIRNVVRRTEDERALLSFARKDRAQCNDPTILGYMANLAGYVQ